MAENEPKHDRLLDHMYDGIQEYDNPLPTWWVAIFWLMIILTPFYIIYYHGGDGRSEIDKYNAEMLAYFDIQANELLSMGPITEGTLAGFQSDPAKMAGAAQIYVSKCSSCHGMRGEGSIGPNLTDTYWLHGGNLTDIYRTITDGVPAKGMLAWKKQLGLGDILSVAAYVGTIRESDPPNAKKPQGKEFVYDLEAILAEERANAPAEESPDEGADENTIESSEESTAGVS
jgi:cytochrome c oxidase cbb3-type subunit 3